MIRIEGKENNYNRREKERIITIEKKENNYDRGKRE